MGKKDKNKKPPPGGVSAPAEPASSGSFLSRRGWKMVGAGIVVVALGFVVLSFTDSRGQNFASDLSPFLIIGGYALIGFGILARDSS